MQRQLFAAASLAVIISITAFASKSDLAVSQGTASPSNSERQEPISGTQSVVSKEVFGLLMEKKMAQTFENWNKIKGALFEYPLAFYQMAGNPKKIGWESNDGLWYFYDDNGKPCEGWIADGKKWYYLEDGMYATGWKGVYNSEGVWDWYYFDDSGAMLSNCQTPDGFTVDENGAWDTKPVNVYDANEFEWYKPNNGALGQISGLMIAGMPAEFYMLSIAGETSGLSNADAIINGDGGKAYGVCQFDYRYDLVGFMRYAFHKHPELWTGFSEFLSGYENGDNRLRSNHKIGRTFLYAMEANYEVAISDQLEYVRKRYWDGFAGTMNRAGYNLSNRHIAVSAALLSVNVNCGSQAEIFISKLSPTMTDDELIRGVYQIRNTILAGQYVGCRKKGTTTRYRQSEPQMALDLLYGYTTIDSNVRYGGGVEWHSNPFTELTTTVALPGNIEFEAYKEESACVATASDAETYRAATDSQAEPQTKEE